MYNTMQYNRGNKDGGAEKMKCTSKVQAERIAKAGAAKMDREGYRIANSGVKALYNQQFRIIKSGEKAAAYIVGIAEGKTFCQCPFYRENAEFGTCKHIERCREEAEFQAWCDEQEAMLAEMHPLIPVIPAATVAACPTCTLCGGAVQPAEDDDAFLDSEGIGQCGECRRQQVAAFGHFASVTGCRDRNVAPAGA
jgi:hypothetical protein